MTALQRAGVSERQLDEAREVIRSLLSAMATASGK
jgi:hypothetical protein